MSSSSSAALPHGITCCLVWLVVLLSFALPMVTGQAGYNNNNNNNYDTNSNTTRGPPSPRNWLAAQFAEIAEARERRSVFDNSDLVVDVTYSKTKNLEITGLTQVEKETMVHAHNAYRSLVRPLASNMLEVTWDDEIATFAQDWANECTATHRPSRDLPPWVNMGENLYWWFSGKYHEAMSVKWWWDEVQFYDINNDYCVPDEVCGHYVTMAWAKTYKIGCGVARCSRLADLPDYGRGAYYFVCSYNARFLSNTKPYIGTDIPCSSCHLTDFPKCRYNLCVTEEMLNNDIGYNGTTDITGMTRPTTRTDEKTGGPNTAPTTAPVTQPTTGNTATTAAPTTAAPTTIAPTTVTVPTTIAPTTTAPTTIAPTTTASTTIAPTTLAPSTTATRPPPTTTATTSAATATTTALPPETTTEEPPVTRRNGPIHLNGLFNGQNRLSFSPSLIVFSLSLSVFVAFTLQIVVTR